MRISDWPELLETWFALTSVNYHRSANHPRATGPWKTTQKFRIIDTSQRLLE